MVLHNFYEIFKVFCPVCTLWELLHILPLLQCALRLVIYFYTLCRYLHVDVRFSVVVKLSVCALREEKSVMAGGGSVVRPLPTHVTSFLD